MLAKHHGFKVSHETVRKGMVEDGLSLSRKQRRQFHQPRLRRECFGELIQIDGSDHRWFEDRASPCTFLVFIDDATSTLMELRFVKSESTFSSFEALESYLHKPGRPVALRSDKHTVFRVAKEDAKVGARITQFGRALSELNIEILCANSSQAKGRVERASRTLQDRLLKDLRLAGISDMEAGNAYLQGFKERHTAKFAKVPAKPDNLHRALNVAPDRLADVLCWRENRYVGKQLTFSYERKRIMLEENDITRGLVGKYVDTYAFVDGRFEVRSKGRSLPYKTFDMEPRVTHAAITENKHLSAVLEQIKEMQDAAPPKPKVWTNSEKMGYKPNWRRPGRPSGTAGKKIAHTAEQNKNQAGHAGGFLHIRAFGARMFGFDCPEPLRLLVSAGPPMARKRPSHRPHNMHGGRFDFLGSITDLLQALKRFPLATPRLFSPAIFKVSGLQSLAPVALRVTHLLC